MLWNAFNRLHNVVNGSYRTKFIKGTVETTPLNVGCDYMSYPFVLKNIFCVVYDATFCCFLLDKRSFFIDCVGFGDKNIIFAV